MDYREDRGEALQGRRSLAALVTGALLKQMILLLWNHLLSACNESVGLRSRP
jgi:hypothetical protein